MYQENKVKAVNGQPKQLYVETLAVTDVNVYNSHQNYSGSTNQNIVFQYMRIYLSHVFNGVFKFL